MATHLNGPAKGKGKLGEFSSWKAYLLAFAISTLWLPAYKLLFHPGSTPMIQVFLLPVIVSAYFGGLGPGLLSTAIVAFITNFFLLEPLHDLHLSHSIDVARWFSFTLIGVVISLLNEALHRAKKHAEAERRLNAVTLTSIGDAVLTTDHQGRVTFLNPEAERLCGWNTDEARGRKLAEVFNIVNKDTRKAVADPVTRVLETGGVVGLANHTLLLAKDGRETPIDDSGAPIKADDGQIVGVVLVFRDCSEKANTQTRLVESVSLLRTTIEASNDGLLVVDNNRRVTIFNRRFLEIWKIPEAIAQEGDDRKVLHLAMDQAAQPEEILMVERMYANPELALLSGTIQLKDGRVLERITYPQRLDDKIIGRVWNFRDVTSHVRAEQSLQLQSVALESAANAIVITNRDGTIEWINPAFTRITGYGVTEALGKNPRELVRSGRHDRNFYHHLWQTILGGNVWHGELTNRRKDGSLFVEEMTITPLTNSENHITHFVAIKQDITERKRMEVELRQASDRSQFYMNRMPLAFIAWDREFRVCEWNPAAEKIFGWNAGEAVGRHAFDLIVPPDVQPAVRQVWQEVVSGGNQANHVTNDNVTKHGGRITCEWRNTAWRDATGQICGLLSLAEDITEQIQNEIQRTELEAQLRQSQKMEAIGQLSGGIAHDFNNILTVIQGNVSLLQYQDLSPTEARECSTQIAQAAGRAGDLTRQLLMFARKQQMQPVPLDLNHTINHVTKMLQRILGEDVTLRTEYAPTLPLIHADIGMVEQIVLNLAVNARDAMSKGGKLTIRTNLLDGHVCLQVTDNGSGIPPEIVPRIFEPFFTTKEVGKGTGLGLATVYGIVQQHQGKINVQSQIGRGTTFTITFPPADKSKITSTTAVAKPAALPQGNETILLVEDERPVRSLVRDLLQRCGYTVLVAESGPAALSLWSTHRNQIDLLFTDIIMPESMTGLDLGRQLLAEKPGLKVIYTSGYTGNIEERNNLELVEGTNFIRKPYQPETLMLIIRKNLNNAPRGFESETGRGKNY